MPRGGASGAHAPTERVGMGGREGIKGIGVNERSSKRGSEVGSSLRAGSVQNATEGIEWRASPRHMHAASNPRTLFFASSIKSLPFFMVIGEVEKVCMGI